MCKGFRPRPRGEGKTRGGKEMKEFILSFILTFVSCSIGIVIGLIIQQPPTALDVYRGKTTLEITYRDSVAVDSVVVYKVR